MKIRLLIARAGKHFSNAPGEVIEVDDAEARTLIERGQAEAVKATPKRKPKAAAE
jgi:hypothetical protein